MAAPSGTMAGVVKQRRLMIELASAQLEGLLFEAPERESGAAAVILHPYAPLGGSMHDHMVLEVRCLLLIFVVALLRNPVRAAAA